MTMAIQSAAQHASEEDFPIKNTFIHFEGRASCRAGRDRALRRCRTDPWDPTLPTLPLSSKGGQGSSCLNTIGEPRAAASDASTSPSVSMDGFPPMSFSFPAADGDGMRTPEPQSPRTETSDGATEPWTTPTAAWARAADWTTIDGTPESWSTPTADWTTPQFAPPVPVAAFSPPMLTLSLQGSCAPNLHAIEGLGVVYGFSLRLADTVGLGIDVIRSHDDRCLIIQDILPDGGIESWNRLLGSSNSKKVVMVGDAIVSANGKTGCDAMLDECKKKPLVKLSMLHPNFELSNEWFNQYPFLSSWSRRERLSPEAKRF